MCQSGGSTTRNDDDDEHGADDTNRRRHSSYDSEWIVENAADVRDASDDARNDVESRSDETNHADYF